MDRPKPRFDTRRHRGSVLSRLGHHLGIGGGTPEWHQEVAHGSRRQFIGSRLLGPGASVEVLGVKNSKSQLGYGAKSQLPCKIELYIVFPWISGGPERRRHFPSLNG
jgi:hypothetical protein